MTVGVVTGAGSGMGRLCVERLRGTVDVLVAVDIREVDIDGTVGVVCDITDRDAVDALARRVTELGPFRSLAHAAGLSPTMADSRRIIDVDLLGTVLLLDAFEPLVVGGSAAVCFSSSSAYMTPLEAYSSELRELMDDPRADGFLDRAVGLLDNPGIAYGWSKKVVQMESAKAAVRWGRGGGRVVSLSPGLIDTPMGRKEFEQHPMMQVMLDHTPLGRLGESDEVAAVVAFLLSDGASFVSGIDVLVDGALMAALPAMSS